MDQHAAHEKILYEKFKKSIENHSVISQPVSPPFVITLTADAGEGSREKFLNAGFDEYMSKPINKVVLNNIVEKFLTK